jgi:hypothetical protein
MRAELEADVSLCARLVNGYLGEDAELKQRSVLPVETAVGRCDRAGAQRLPSATSVTARSLCGRSADLLVKLRDGIIVAKLINAAVPGACSRARRARAG